MPCPRRKLWSRRLSGLAIVTTDRHGESSYIVNGENGFVSNDMEALLAHVCFLYGGRPKEVQRIGANGRATARRIFGSEKFWRSGMRFSPRPSAAPSFERDRR